MKASKRKEPHCAIVICATKGLDIVISIVSFFRFLRHSYLKLLLVPRIPPDTPSQGVFLDFCRVVFRQHKIQFLRGKRFPIWSWSTSTPGTKQRFLTFRDFQLRLRKSPDSNQLMCEAFFFLNSAKELYIWNLANLFPIWITTFVDSLFCCPYHPCMVSLPTFTVKINQM